MTTIGSGKIYFGSDFTGIFNGHGPGDSGVIAAGGENLENGVGLIAVNEGAYASLTDESGGVLSITTDTADNDNAALVAGKFAPRDGKMIVRSRFKVLAIDSVGIFAGFAETMSIAAPVMPAEFATSTMTYNPGGLIGLQFDSDGSTDDWRAVMGDGSAAISDSSQGIRANATNGNDSFWETEVILNEDGSGECWLGHSGNQNSSGFNKLTLVKRFSAGTLLTNTDTFYAVLMVEAHNGGGAEVLETDYFYGDAGRDWRD